MRTLTSIRARIVLVDRLISIDRSNGGLRQRVNEKSCELEHAGKFLWKSAHEQDECASDVTNQRGRPDQVRAYRRRHTIVRVDAFDKKKKNKKIKNRRDRLGYLGRSFTFLQKLDYYFWDFAKPATLSKDEDRWSLRQCFPVPGLLDRKMQRRFEVWNDRWTCRADFGKSTSKSKCSPPVIQPKTKRPFLAAFMIVFSCVWRRDSTAAAQQWLIGASAGCCSCLHAAHPLPLTQILSPSRKNGRSGRVVLN